MSLSRVGSTVLALIAAVIAAYALFQALDNRAAPPIVIEDGTANQPIVVDVRGAVNRSGVYTLPPGARVNDAIAVAGGVSAEADLASLNLARRLRDGEVVSVAQIPVLGSSPVPPASSAAGDNADSPTLRVNLNTASAAELDALPGIGSVIAQRIVEFREELGRFGTSMISSSSRAFLTAPSMVSAISSRSGRDWHHRWRGRPHRCRLRVAGCRWRSSPLSRSDSLQALIGGASRPARWSC